MAVVFIVKPTIPQETIEKEDLPPDLSLIKEARRLVSLHGEKAWPGFGTDLPPILLETDEFSYLIGLNAETPEGFRKIEGQNEILGKPNDQDLSKTIATRPIAGNRTVVAPPRKQLGQLLERETDKSNYRMSKYDYVQKLIEGIFKVHILQFFGDHEGFLSGLGSRSSQDDIKTRLEDSAKTNWKSRLMNLVETLSRGLEVDDLSGARKAAGKIVRLTGDPSGGLGDDVREFERSVQLLDGTARYVGINTMSEASKKEIDLTSEISYPDPGKIKFNLLKRLNQPLKSRSSVRERLKDLGAAKGMLLDRLFPGWKEILLEDKVSLNELLDRALEVPEQLESFPITKVRVAGYELTVGLAEEPEQRQQGLMYVTDLGRLDGMVFYFPREVQGGFWMKNTKIPLQIGYFRSSGELARSMLMKPCRSASCPTYSPGKSYRYALELPTDSRLRLRDHPKATIDLSYHPGD